MENLIQIPPILGNRLINLYSVFGTMTSHRMRGYAQKKVEIKKKEMGIFLENNPNVVAMR